MFTGFNLATLIVNSLVPLLWFGIIIKNIKDYFDLRVFTTEVLEDLSHDESDLPPITDDTTPECRRHVESAKLNVRIIRTRIGVDLKFARYTMMFWTFIGLVFILTGTTEVIRVGLRAYHCQCPYDHAHTCRVQVENAKEGPQFTATLRNVKLEEVKKDE